MCTQKDFVAVAACEEVGCVDDSHTVNAEGRLSISHLFKGFQGVTDLLNENLKSYYSCYIGCKT